MPEETDAKRAAERIGHLVRMAARGFNRALQIRLADHEVTFGQWVFLRILWEQDGLTQRELSEEAGLTEPTTHTALQRLEAHELLERRNLPGNRRKQHVFLTDRGRALRDTLEPLAVEVNDVALAGLSAVDREALREALLTILQNLDSDEAEARSKGRRVPPTRLPPEV